MTSADQQEGTKPVPDPTRLTTEAMSRLVAERGILVEQQLATRDARLDARSEIVDKQIEGLRSLVLERMAGEIGRLEQRLDDMDKANIVLSDDVNRVPTNLQTAMASLNTLNDVKFTSLADALAVLRNELTNRFELLDRQTVREKAAADLAVNAAFAAADKAAAAAAAASTEAIRKSEAATAETIKTNAQAQVAGNKALSDKIDDDRDRIARTETLVNTLQTAIATRGEARTDTRAGQNLGLVVIGVVLSIIATVAVVYGLTGR